jgi:hypothetical protein
MTTPFHLNHLEPAALKSLNAAGQVAESIEREDLESEIIRLNLLKTPVFELLRQNEIKATAYEHEYVVVTNRADKIGYSAFREGALPRTVDIDTARRKIRPSLMGTRIQVTELALRTTENGITRIDELAKREKMQALVQDTEYYTIYGSNKLGSDQPGNPNNLQQDGLVEIVKNGAPMNVVDAEGQRLNIDLLWTAERNVISKQAIANPTDVIISYADKQILQDDFYQRARVVGEGERRGGLLGADAQSYIGIGGEHTFHVSPFVGDFHQYTETQVGHDTGEYAVPAIPVVASAAASADPDAWVVGSAADNGQYAVRYFLKACNFHGEAAGIETADIDMTFGQRTTIRLSGVGNTKWFDVYRAEGDARPKFLKRVPHYGGATATIVDDGYESIVNGYGSYRWRKIPGTGVVIGLDKNVTSYATWIGMEQYNLPPALSRDMVFWRVSSLFSRAPEFSYLIVNVNQDTE